MDFPEVFQRIGSLFQTFFPTFTLSFSTFSQAFCIIMFHIFSGCSNILLNIFQHCPMIFYPFIFPTLKNIQHFPMFFRMFFRDFPQIQHIFGHLFPVFPLAQAYCPGGHHPGIAGHNHRWERLVLFAVDPQTHGAFLHRPWAVEKKHLGSWKFF